MKKNTMMRVASVLLIAVLLSTCAISGTFAKYVTQYSATASARVAKFGVVISGSGNLFSAAYIHAPSAADDSSTVLAYNSTDTLVAPGTKNTDGLVISLTGTPEVDVNVSIDVNDSTLKDVYLAAGTYTDMTNKEETFTLANDYYPVVYTLTQTKDGGAPTVLASGKMSQIVTALEGLTTDYTANTNLAEEIGDLKITWEWNFTKNAGIELDDQADTYLGDLAAGMSLSGVYNLTAAIDITVTVTQID